MIWDYPHILDLLADALAGAERALRDEQAVYGLDSLSELAIHERLADALKTSFDVAREVHYPSSVGNKLTHRQRCDLVLTPLGKPLRLDRAPPSLFDPVEQSEPSDALWLEVKVAYQYREGGAAHSGYSGQWRQALTSDLQKMQSEPLIAHAGLLLVVFVATEEIFQKDVQLLEDLLVRKDVLAGFRHTRAIPILERMGHGICALALWPTPGGAGQASI